MAHRKLVIAAASLVIIVAVISLLIAHPWVHPPKQVLAANASLTYTDSVTGETDSDLPQETGSLIVGQIILPGVEVDGTDALDAYLTDDQAQMVADDLKNFLAARSGLSAVRAGIQNKQILQSNNKLSFTLIADRPQASYHVTIDTSDSLNPGVTIVKAE